MEQGGFRKFVLKKTKNLGLASSHPDPLEQWQSKISLKT